MADCYSFNRVILVGHVCQDPVYKEHGTSKLCKIRLATNEIFSVFGGEDREPRHKVEYHNLIAWGKTAEFIYKHAEKGALVCIEGRIRTTFYTRAGEKKKTYYTQIDIMSFSFLGKIKEGKEPGEAEDPNPEEETEEPEEKQKKPKKSKKDPKDECPF